MGTTEARILHVDALVTESITQLRGDRKLLSQQMLGYVRELVESVIVLAHTEDLTSEYSGQVLAEAIADVSSYGRSAFLQRFHRLLLIDGEHHERDGDTSERLMLKYYEYLRRLRDMLRHGFALEILSNLDAFPVDVDSSLREYHQKIAERVSDIETSEPGYRTTGRFYVYKSRPFFVDDRIYYEVTFTNSVDRVSKFDRVIAFTHLDVGDRYAANLTLQIDSIDVLEQTMPIIIITGWEVSIRPCEIRNLARILGPQLKVSTSNNEYAGLMRFLTATGASLTDLMDFSDQRYAEVRAGVLRSSRTESIFPVLDRARRLIRAKRPGAVVLRYLMLRTRNVILRRQYAQQPCSRLSDLNLSWGCIPFEEMPFCTSLPRHNPRFGDLIDALDPEGRDHELLARLVKNNVERRGMLYTPIEELESFPKPLALIEQHNQTLYYRHHSRDLLVHDGAVFIRGYEDNIVQILEKLQSHATTGVGGWRNAVEHWLGARPDYVDDDNKAAALKGLFERSHVALIYGSAGTGKSTMVNYIADFFNDGRTLFLANTHPAVDNLRRKVKSRYPKFNTIAGQLSNGQSDPEYDLVVIDECSTVSNEDLLALFGRIRFKVLVLVGDVYQIESIQFGNWFSLARHLLPNTGVFELTKPYRSSSPQLLELWDKVRNVAEDITETMAAGRFSTVLNESIFEPQRTDEIILCLNYDGLYGINNINRFLQSGNPHPAMTWGPAIFKVGDPVLFNEAERFKPFLYNNLKGTISDIHIQPGLIRFEITLDRDVTEISASTAGLEWVYGSTVAFTVAQLIDSDDDDQNVETTLPFQVAYAVSIHKAQGLEYDSVKVVITDANHDDVSHSILYTAITRARDELLVYWTPDTQEAVLASLVPKGHDDDVEILAERRGLRPV